MRRSKDLVHGRRCGLTRSSKCVVHLGSPCPKRRRKPCTCRYHTHRPRRYRWKQRDKAIGRRTHCLPWRYRQRGTWRDHRDPATHPRVLDARQEVQHPRPGPPAKETTANSGRRTTASSCESSAKRAPCEPTTAYARTRARSNARTARVSRQLSARDDFCSRERSSAWTTTGCPSA